MRLSPHPALPLSFQLRLRRVAADGVTVAFRRCSWLRFRHVGTRLVCPGCTTACRPSPCGRLSRPLTTMAAPTLPRFHRPVCWAPFQGSLPRSCRWTLRGRLGGGYPSPTRPLFAAPDRRRGNAGGPAEPTRTGLGLPGVGCRTCSNCPPRSLPHRAVARPRPAHASWLGLRPVAIAGGCWVLRPATQDICVAGDKFPEG
jgi:hypothetical protein